MTAVSTRPSLPATACIKTSVGLRPSLKLPSMKPLALGPRSPGLKWARTLPLKPLWTLLPLTVCWPSSAAIWAMFTSLPLAPVLAIMKTSLNGSRSETATSPALLLSSSSVFIISSSRVSSAVLPGLGSISPLLYFSISSSTRL